MNEEELDAAVADYRSKKRCIGHCDRVLPNTDEFFSTDIRTDRGNRRLVRSKCKRCAQDDEREAKQAVRYELEPDPGYEMTFEEIAKELGWSRQKVHIIYKRAIAKLIKPLGKIRNDYERRR